MPRLTCPNCETNFETAGARHTSCPACGSRLDTRGPDGVRVVSGPTRTSEKIGGRSPFDAADELAEIPKPKKEKANRPRTIVIRTGSNNDHGPRAALAILVGATVLGCLLIGIIITLVWYLGERPSVAANSKSIPTTQPTPSFNDAPSPGAPNADQPAFGPGLFAGNGPRQSALPTPRGNLPGIDPTEFPQSGTEIGGPSIQDILDLFPPGFFGPDGPGGGLGGGEGPGGRGPTAPPPAGTVLVTLSNLRLGNNRIEIDFDYGSGTGHPLDRFIVVMGNTTGVIRSVGVPRGRGTLTSVIAITPGPVQVWLERRTTPNAQAERISNILSR